MWTTRAAMSKQQRLSSSLKLQFAAATANSQIALFSFFSSNFYLLLSFISIILTAQLVGSSPPVDYFVYTSQMASAKVGTINVTSFLPSLESIYELSPKVNEQSATPAANGAAPKPMQPMQQQQLHLQDISRKVLAIVRNMSHTHDNDMIDLEITRMAWHLMEQQALIYTRNRLEAARPAIEELLAEASISDQCHSAITKWMDKLSGLEKWASLMWNSWGDFPPSGLFAGSFTDLGSYRGCLSIDDNEIIGQSQYCTLDFQPLIPTRPRFHSIFKKVLSVDKQNRLIGGDYKIDNINSKLSSHGFSSARFSDDNLEGENILENPTAAAAASAGLLLNRYNKRTIVHNGTEDSTTQPPQQELSSSSTTGTGTGTAAGSISSNLTLKAEALIELALKAQYFYYVKFRIGACLPSKCSQDDVQNLAQTAGQRAILQTNQVNCMKKEPSSQNGYQKLAIWVLSSLAMIAVLGTIVDLLGFKVNRTKNTLPNWLLPFSIWTNSQRLFDSDTAGTHGDLECIHGLRFFSMIWVIYGHTILYTEYQGFTHFYDVIETQIPSFILLPTLNANFSVDTFFVISGILTTYVTWEYTKGDVRKFNKFAFAISRYIRLTPQLAIVILCFFLLPLFGSGPMYKQVTEDKANTCYKNWGINLLYMQSYLNSEKLCIDPSWWLSIEMTFHLISMFLIVVILHSPSKGMLVNFIVAAALTLWGAQIHYTNGFAIQYLPSIPQRYEVTLEQTKMFFHRPYPHAAAYFIGIALGYVFANRSIKKLTQAQVYQGWIVCSFGLITCLWSSYFWNLGAPYTQLQSTIYYNLCQVLWPISIAWIILACSLGHGGIVEKILTARCFVPLGRITYMTYLSHALIIYYHSASMNIPVEPSMLLFVYLFVANTFLAMLLGVILTVVYESPILNLQKQFFSYLTQRFDPTVQNQMSTLPTTITCENRNGTSREL